MLIVLALTDLALAFFFFKSISTATALFTVQYMSSFYNNEKMLLWSEIKIIIISPNMTF